MWRKAPVPPDLKEIILPERSILIAPWCEAFLSVLSIVFAKAKKGGVSLKVLLRLALLIVKYFARSIFSKWSYGRLFPTLLRHAKKREITCQHLECITIEHSCSFERTR